MSEKSFNFSLSSFFSEECNSINVNEIEENISDVIADLKLVQSELQKDLSKNCYDSTSRSCKINQMKTSLELIDNKLLNVNHLIKPNPLKQDDLISNFGMSLKVENAKSKLNETVRKHGNLRKEWYSQEEHLNKLANEVEIKENELQLKSIFCTTQGLILSKMLWKSSNFNPLLDKIISNSKLALELVKTLDGCLYAFTQTYYDEMPEPSAEEYQYVLCLCGILSNLASVPDGRFLLTSQSVCKDVYDQIIKILPNILVPKAENLKWIMLTAIHNLMICKEGEDYARNNVYLLKSLGECISVQHSNKIIMLVLKIMSILTNEITNKSYMKHISNYLPVRRLQELRLSKDSSVFRKQAKTILYNVMRSSKFFGNLEREELIHSTRLDDNRSRCRMTGTQTYSNKQTPEVLAYYVLTDQSKTATTTSQSSSSSAESSEEESEPVKLSTETSYRRMSTETSTTPSSSKKSKIIDVSFSFPLPKRRLKRATHSAPVPSNRGQYSSHPVSPVYSTRQSDEENSSTFLAHNEAKRRKSVQTSYPMNKKFNSKAASSLCYPSTMSISGNAENIHQPLEEPTPSVSEEIQTVQCQAPQINLNKFFSITIGDNLQNANRNNVGTTYVDKENAGSIVTVFRISQSKALLTSDNSFTPFYSNISTNTSFPWEAAMSNLFKMQTHGVSRRSTAVETSNIPKAGYNNDSFDIAYGGYGSYFTRLKYRNRERPHYSQMFEPELVTTPQFDHYNPQNMPSTSTGNYGYGKRYSPFAGIRDENVPSSGSILDTKQTSVTKFETKAVQSKEYRKKSKINTNKKSAGSVQSKKSKKKISKKKGPIFRIFKKGKRR